MKKILISITILTCMVAVASCDGTPTPDTQASVDAAVAATSEAEDNQQATIESAVQATAEAVPTPTVEADYTTQSEEELAAAVDQAVEEATTTTQESSDAATEATADGTLTLEEVEAIELYLADAEEAILFAEELIWLYYDLYGELATETLNLLEAIDEDLAALAIEVIALADALEAVDAALQQGLTLAGETISQIEAAAASVGINATSAQEQARGLIESVQAEIEDRAVNALAVQPNLVPGTRQEAIQSAVGYVATVRQALGDGRISAEELADIAQVGANAAAGLSTQGGERLQALSVSIDSITAQLARGQAVQAQAALGEIEALLDSLPSRP
jgi:hypothetical protein